MFPHFNFFLQKKYVSRKGQSGRRGFFFTMDRILQSLTLVVIHGLPGLCLLLSCQLIPSFLKMFQTAVLDTYNVFAISLMS